MGKTADWVSHIDSDVWLRDIRVRCLKKHYLPQRAVSWTQLLLLQAFKGQMLILKALGGLRIVGPEGAALLRRRNDLAVLAVLADRSPRAVRREEVQALFWGERSEEKARHSLRQVVLTLRRELGAGFEADAGSMRVVAGTVQYDVKEFVEAVDAGRLEHAIALWSGDFLLGCEDIGAEGFRAWLEVERERLRRLLASCHERMVAEVEATGDVIRAAQLAGAWSAAFPLDARASARHIELLCVNARVAEAAAAQGVFTQRLRVELDEEPDEGWLASTNASLLAARDAEDVLSRARRAAAPVEAAPELATSPAASRTRQPRFRWPVALAAAIVLLSIGGVGARMARSRASGYPAIAVGRIMRSGSDSLDGFRAVLTTNLARIPGLDVISERRMSEISGDAVSRSTDEIARIGGAHEIIEGTLTPQPNGALRADLRRTDLSSGKILNAYSVEAVDQMQLADMLTEQVARDLGTAAPISRREGTTTSIIAYRFYEQGLRAYYANDLESAMRMFGAALAEDSTFAMAAYSAAITTLDSVDYFYGRALRHAQRTNRRERLLISTAFATKAKDPRGLVLADSLVSLYPSDPDAHLMFASELARTGRLREALPHFAHVVEMDSARGASVVHCRACDAMAGLIETHTKLGAYDSASRVALSWIRWQPESARAWQLYSTVLGAAERLGEAHAAADSMAKYAKIDGLWLHAIWWYHEQKFADLERLWRSGEQSRSAVTRSEGLWTHVIVAATQGRMREALGAAREYRRHREAVERRHIDDALLEAVMLERTGRQGQAARIFDSIAVSASAPFPAGIGASRSWSYLNEAGAVAAIGDTIALKRLDDSVRVNGAIATERYKRLHHYTHGLLLSARGKPAEAADAFKLALWTEQDTHVRIYLELARALVAAKRPAEAVAPLRAALRGPVSAAGLYVTRTDLQELLAVVYEQSGQRDSAVANYKRVATAWKNADPEFAGRRAVAVQRVAQLDHK